MIAFSSRRSTPSAPLHDASPVAAAEIGFVIERRNDFGR